MAGCLTSLASLVCSTTLLACSGSSSTPYVPPFEGGTTQSSDSSTPQRDSGSQTTPDAAIDSGGQTTGDGAAPAMRNSACTPLSDQTGTAVDTSHGRLDGNLVFVVLPGQGKECNGDDSHVHLQVEVSGDIYDIAVDIGTAPNDEVGLYEETIALPDGAFSPGWNGSDSLAYPSMGIHSTSFTTGSPTDIASQVEAMLADTTTISVFCTGYSQGNGCHDVHYENGSGKDGAIVLNPTAATSPVLFFRFASQSF